MSGILVVSHTGRTDALEATRDVCRQLAEAGTPAILPAEQWPDVIGFDPSLREIVRRIGDGIELSDVELVISLGGDGTILRAAELVRGHSIPLLGVNLGHVGFLAESERDSVADTVRRAISADYRVDERLALEVVVSRAGETLHESWALNEVTVEKSTVHRMLELVLEVDGRPLSSFGCDGMIMATPTGSTAYAFSAGGPVIWPSVDALLCVPLSAHALFSRPLVVGTDSTLAVEILGRAPQTGALVCDGRRIFELRSGDRVTVSRSSEPVRLARLHDAPFTDRLVDKFDLPVHGWRGPQERA